jgi:hypothetical protein
MCPLREPPLRTTLTSRPLLTPPSNPNPQPKRQQQHKRQHRNRPPLKPHRPSPKSKPRRLPFRLPLRRRRNLAPPRHRRHIRRPKNHRLNSPNGTPQTCHRRRRRPSRALRKPKTRPKRKTMVRSAQSGPGKHRHPPIHHLRRHKRVPVPGAQVRFRNRTTGAETAILVFHADGTVFARDDRVEYAVCCFERWGGGAFGCFAAGV